MNISSQGLHIINGLSAAGSWKQAHRVVDRLLIQQDILSCGPTPSYEDLAKWEETRIAYLKEIRPEWQELDFKSLDSDLLNNVKRLTEFDEIFLWIGTGLEDQLLVLFVVCLAEKVGANSNQICLVQYEQLATRKFPVRLMGELNPEQMSKHPTPTPLTKEDIVYCRSAWAALTSADPLRLEHFASSNDCPLPHIQEAMNYMRRRYPHRRTGLTYWDGQLLENVQNHGPRAAYVIGYTIASDLADGDGDCVGDGYLFYRLRRLGSDKKPEPLIQLHGTTHSIRETSVEITDFGRSIVSGETSSYPTNPIDEWIGGVHLSSESRNLWFYEDGRLYNANET